MFNFIQTPIVNGCTLLAIEPLSQGDRAFNSTYPPEPIRVSVRSLRSMSDERRHHANAFNARGRIAEAVPRADQHSADGGNPMGVRRGLLIGLMASYEDRTDRAAV